MSWRSKVVHVTTILLILLFGTAGTLKLLPHLINDPDFKAEFRRYVAIPPINMIRLDPDIYRTIVAVLELLCAVILAIGTYSMQKTVNLVLVVVMIGALYTHFMVNDSPDKFGGAIIGMILCLVRLYYTGHLKVKVG